MEELKEGLRQFVEHTTVHGIKDVVHAKTLCWKCVWFMLFFTSFCGTFYFIISMGVDCNNQPTTTKLSWLKQDFYDSPTMSFCPTTWVNESKALALGLTTNIINFLEDDHTAIDLDAIEFEIFSEQVLYAMSKTGTSSIPELYHSIALEPRAVIGCKVCNNLVDLYQMYQICYTIDYGPMSSREINTLGTTYLSYKNMYRSMLEYSGLLVIGEGVYSEAVGSGIKTRPGHLYLIQVSSKQIIQLSKRNEPCSETKPAQTIASLDMARMNCYAKKFTAAMFCRYCFGLVKMKEIKNKNYSDWYENTTLEDRCSRCNLHNIDEFAENCLLDDFLPPCKRWVFEYTFNTETMSRNGESRSDFTIVYMPIYGVEVLEEVLICTWESFLSNIGGQLGLWLGASFLSCFQLVYYVCIEPCITRRALSRPTESAVYVTKC